MIVIGIKCVGHDTGAAILSDNSGVLKYNAIAESRLNRYKHSYQFPLLSIKYCLEAFGLDTLDDVDLIAIDRHVNQMGDINNVKNKRKEEYEFDENDRRNYSLFHSLKYNKKLISVDHISAHAAAAYYLSPFQDASILIVDGGLGIYKGEGDQIKRIDRVGYMDGYLDGIKQKKNWFDNTGNFYRFVTEILGYGNSGFAAGKTMGLAAYGDKVKRKNYLKVNDKRHKSTWFDYSQEIKFARDNLEFFDPKKHADGYEGLISEKWINIARQAQEILNEDMCFLVGEAHRKAKSNNLCLGGGVALSCVANKKIIDTYKKSWFKRKTFKDFFIQPSASDEGIPLGVALLAYYRSGGVLRSHMKSSYLGKCYKEKNKLEELLENTGLEYRNSDDKEVAEYLAQGKIIARCNGPSEYGPRALGNRSILADPRSKDMREKINKYIKHRESYRPFAPSCLAEYQKEYFDLEVEAPFMIIAAKVKKKWIDVLPAITHQDNSSRPQAVKKDQNSKYYNLIKEFGDLTGVYCLLNTSFNDNDEPIVETHKDAIRTMLKTNVDMLYIEEYLVFPKFIREKKINIDIYNDVKDSYQKLMNDFIDIDKYNELASDLECKEDWQSIYVK